MRQTVQAFFDGEVLRPQGAVDLAPNSIYRVTIEEQIAVEAPASSARGDRIALAADLDLPADFAEQHDHYLYGTPKR